MKYVKSGAFSLPGEPSPEGKQGAGGEECAKDGLVVGGEPKREVDVEVGGAVRGVAGGKVG